MLAASGEDAIAFSDSGPYAANVELAEALAPAAQPPTDAPMRTVDTPDAKTIAELVAGYGVPIERTVKTLVVQASEDVEGGLVALLVRGDHELNAVKAMKLAQVAEPLRMASEAEIRAAVGAGPGSLGPVGLPIPCVVDRTVAASAGFSAGANVDGKHLFDIHWGRDVALPEVADLRNVVDGDPSPDGNGSLVIRRGIEVGHIFQLGQKYSRAMNATVLDENGRGAVMTMGCYGIGVSRVVAAAIEQNYDEAGIVWPEPIAPFTVALCPIGRDRSAAVREAADALYAELTAAGVEVLFDDRGLRPGQMFADIELIGIPHRLVVSDRLLAEGQLEYRARRAEAAETLPRAEALARVLNSKHAD